MQVHAKIRAKPRWWLVGGLLLIFSIQAFTAAVRDSVTIDEFPMPPSGLYILQSHDFSFDTMNPPLPRILAALAARAQGISFHPPAGMGYYKMAYRFMEENAEKYHGIFVRTRLVFLGAAVLLGVLVFFWASRLYGPDAGWIALFLFAFSPEMLAHGHLVTLDMPGAIGFTATLFLTGIFLDRPTVFRGGMMGAAMGVAVLLKLSGVILVPIVMVIARLRAMTKTRSPDQRPLPRRDAGLAAALLAALLVINAGYGFQGTGAPLDMAGVSFHPRLPLPKPLLQGIASVMRTGKTGEATYFLSGELTAGGWWYYHLAAFLFKTPLPLLIAGSLAFAAWLQRPRPGIQEHCLFVPIVAIFAANSLFNSLYIGVRHVLPVYPLLFVAVSPLFASGVDAIRRPSKKFRDWVAAGATVAGLVWYAAGTLSISPRYLQYFNEIAGGPARGHEKLIDSNLDWGQDLIRLKEYMERKGYSSVHLAYFGRVNPAIYHIPFTPLEGQSVKGIVVVSASFLMGRPYVWFRNGEIGWIPAGTYTWLKNHKPIDRVGAFFVYEF